MKWMKIGLWTVCLAVLLTAHIVSFADDPPVSAPEQQQTIVAPADQSADQQMPPVAPVPQEEGQNQETGK
jgi:hypothetical protein